MWTFFKIQ